VREREREREREKERKRKREKRALSPSSPLARSDSGGGGGGGGGGDSCNGQEAAGVAAGYIHARAIQRRTVDTRHSCEVGLFCALSPSCCDQGKRKEEETQSE